jgi:hypothetical protein
MNEYTIKSTTTGFIVVNPDGTAKQFAKLWLALSWLEKQLGATK